MLCHCSLSNVQLSFLGALLPTHHSDPLHLHKQTRNRQAGHRDQRTRRKALFKDLLSNRDKPIAIPRISDELVIVTMSLSVPPCAFSVFSMDANTSRTCASKFAAGGSDAVCPPSQRTFPPSVVTARENARSCARASGA